MRACIILCVTFVKDAADAAAAAKAQRKWKGMEDILQWPRKRNSCKVDGESRWKDPI